MRVYFTIILALLVYMTAGCTRKSDKHSLSIKVPVAQKVGALSVYSLDFAVVNVVIPGRPAIVMKKEMKDSNSPAIAAGSPVVFDVPVANPPANASIFVQALNIYRGDDAGDLKFFYGDAYTVVQGETNVVIEAQPSGTSNGKEAQIAGRFFDSGSGGPTGELVAFFDMGNGKLPMIVEKRAMIDGWFEAFAIQGANMDYRVNGTLIFDDLNLDAAGNLRHNVAGTMTNVTFNARRLHMRKPLSYRHEDSSIKPQPETNLILGYFDNNGDSFVNAVTRAVVYPTGIKEGIPGAFTNSTTEVPQQFNTLSGFLSTDVVHVAGGSSAPANQIYTVTSTPCSSATYNAGDCLTFNHIKMAGGGREGYSGMAAPFRTMDLAHPREAFATAKYFPAGCAGQNCIKLKWALLPGSTSVTDMEVWYKASNSGGGGDRDRSCADLEGQGYSKAPGTANMGAGQFDYTNAALTQSNAFNYSFYLCPKVGTGTTARYMGRMARVDCMGQCENMNHLGWAPAGNTPVSTTLTHGSTYRVNGSLNVSSPYYTSVDLMSGSFAFGDEVMINILGARGTNACGTRGGQTLGVGTYGFARVIDGVGTVVKLSKGTFLEDMAASAVSDTTLQADPVTTDFCFVTLTKVLHYNDLTINASTQINTYAFAFGTPTGGIIPIRVSGKLSMAGNSWIRAYGGGYPGGAATYHGAGSDWDTDNSGTVANNAGEQGTLGGGGGGHGRGGEPSGGGSGGQGQQNGGGNVRLVMGGGGGGSSSDVGSAGGGIVFVAANVVIANGSGNLIDASGGNGLSSGSGGAGGGGSVFLLARKAGSTNAGSLDISAKGGDGFNAGGGGIGGGGSVTRLVCSTDSSYPVTIAASVVKGTAGGDANGSSPGQNGSDTVWSASSNSHYCSDN